MSIIIEGALVLPDSVTNAQLKVENKRIVSIEADPSKYVIPDIRIGGDELVCPGFIDIQINGAFGKEFKTDGDAPSHVSKRLLEFGTTAFLPTVTTLPLGEYATVVGNLIRDAADCTGAKFLGIHLEGPALNPKKVGAQSAEMLCSPSDLFGAEYLNDKVCLVTLAPELPKGQEFVKKLLEMGLRVGVGHSTIDYNELTSLFDKDRMVIVHAFNAMNDLNSRNPGLIGAALDRDEFYTSIIVDRIHVSDPTVRIFWKCKLNRSKIIAITDGSAVSGLEPGTYRIGHRSIEKRKDRAVLSGTETLVGSTLTMNAAVNNILSVTGCAIPEAVATASLNPAEFLGLSQEIGSLDVGKLANLSIVKQDFTVIKTMVDGDWVWGAEK